jgi:pimeloyl-ACP methyl ester carboxylesterase
MVEHIERVMDEAGVETAHVAGNSLGGYVALQLGARGRARSVTAFAPAGGWDDDAGKQESLDLPPTLSSMVSDPSQLHPDTVAHILAALAGCRDAPRMIEFARHFGYPVGPIECPLRIVWGTEDRLLPWPSAAARYRRELPHADWVVLDGVGHCPQLELPLETAELILA